MNKFQQPSSLLEIVDALEAIIAEVPGISKQMAATDIVYGILYGNNAVDVRTFFDDYPELQTIAEAAADLEYQDDDLFWNTIVNVTRQLRARLTAAGSLR